MREGRRLAKPLAGAVYFLVNWVMGIAMEFDGELYHRRVNVERDECWSEWVNRIPALKFPSDWEIKIIPPFRGAMVRFGVRHNNIALSVYLDVNCRLGYFDGPYWEVYPVDGDTHRCAMDNTAELLAVLNQCFEPAGPLQISEQLKIEGEGLEND